MTKMIPILVTILLSAAIGRAEDLGTLSANPFDFESSSNAFGKGSPFAPNGINNLFSPTAVHSAISLRRIPLPPTRRSETRNAHGGSSRNHEVAS